MTATLDFLLETLDLLDALTEALESLTPPPARRRPSDQYGCAIRRASRSALVGGGVFHGGLLIAVGDRVADAPDARSGRHATGRMRRPFSYPRRRYMRGRMSTASDDD